MMFVRMANAQFHLYSSCLGEPIEKTARIHLVAREDIIEAAAIDQGADAANFVNEVVTKKAPTQRLIQTDVFCWLDDDPQESRFFVERGPSQRIFRRAEHAKIKSATKGVSPIVSTHLFDTRRTQYSVQRRQLGELRYARPFGEFRPRRPRRSETFHNDKARLRSSALRG